jgi:hypothetical protein
MAFYSADTVAGKGIEHIIDRIIFKRSVERQ